MNTEKVIVLARKYVGNGAVMESSARLCLAESVALYDAGNDEAARARAIRSLGYSIGILHPDYAKAIS